jgi:uridine kinase
MERTTLVNYLATLVLQVEKSHPVRVGIDGPDAAGKTTLAEELVGPIEARGRPVIRASVDGFHNRAAVRHRRGAGSPEGFYRDSFDYAALAASLLIPLGPGGSRQYRTAVFDHRTDSEVQVSSRVAEANTVLLFDGVFLLRPELAGYWDLTVFVGASFETTLARAERRDAALFGGVDGVRERYRERYIPGQRLYYAEARPQERADVVIDNDDPRNPSVTPRSGIPTPPHPPVGFGAV